MDYGTPMQNQNKGYAKQEKKDLMKDMPIDKRASGGSAMPMMGSTSFMSKHSSAMRMMMPDEKAGNAPTMKKDSALYASEKVMNTFDKDGDGKPFEKEDLKALRSKKK